MCPICKQDTIVNRYRRLTQYNNEPLNWIICCVECKAEDDSHWKEMWSDYYGSQGFAVNQYEDMFE